MPTIMVQKEKRCSVQLWKKLGYYGDIANTKKTCEHKAWGMSTSEKTQSCKRRMERVFKKSLEILNVSEKKILDFHKDYS